MSAVLYTSEEREQDALYHALSVASRIRLDVERLPHNSGEAVLRLVEREKWVTDAKARVYNMRLKGWKLTRLLADMCRAEGVAT